jgi:hypothetical protein
VRPRALPLLLSLAVGDYLLWHWSVAGSHDVLALASGLTLLPLAAVSLGLAGLTVLRVLARSLRKSSRIARSVRNSRNASPAAQRSAVPAPQPASPPERLAA